MSSKDINQILNHLRKGVKILNPAGDPPTSCSDPDDNHILHITEYSKSQMIITGDNDLLKMVPYKSIEIISPREYKIRFLL
ncbi:putative toxin-antitoxin system toxin component, PIN family [Leptospira sp. WS92.C1]